MSNPALSSKLEADLHAEFSDAIVEAVTPYDILQVVIEPGKYHAMAQWLKTHQEWEFNHFLDITVVDHLNRFEGYRYEVVVHVRSHRHNLRLRFKVRIADGKVPSIPTISDVWVGASWPEREVFDMYGVTFTGHPRMTRIMNPDDFIGHPLRKDFPVKGMYRGSFPKGSVISNKRREAVASKTTKARPADQMVPNTPWELRRKPMQEKVNGNGHTPTGEEKGDA